MRPEVESIENAIFGKKPIFKKFSTEKVFYQKQILAINNTPAALKVFCKWTYMHSEADSTEIAIFGQ